MTTTLAPAHAVRPADVLLVGHCGPDSFLLKSVIRRLAPDAQVRFVNDTRTLNDYLHADALVLVNRELDGSFIVESGIELIRQLSREISPPRMMLISNFEWAQKQAQEAGALTGFGKASIGTPSTTALLAHVLGRE